MSVALGELMNYLHAISLDDFLPCHNFGFTGRIQSPNYLASIEPGLRAVHKPIEYFSIEDLRQNGYSGGAVTPRSAMVLIKAAILRRRLHMVDGYGNEIIVSENEKHRVLKLSELELLLEQLRRSFYPDKVSRLSCLWLADANEEGVRHIKSMLGDQVYIVNVEISNQLAFSKANTYWFDEFVRTGDMDYTHRYWVGESAPQGGRWEYLLDGEIVISDPEQLEYIRNNGCKSL